jgi:uncharacterized membrane protein
LAATGTIAGVTGVDNRLEAHGDPTGIPGLQGEGRVLSTRLLPGTWSPAARLIAGIIGLRAARMGLSRGGLLGTIVGLGGIGILYRAFMNPNNQRLVRWDGGHGGVEIEKTITLKAPVAEVFGLWRNPENFPRFMSHLVEVKRLDDRRHHWVAKGPAGVPAEWDSEITQLEPNRIVAWKSVPGSMVETAGHIRFEAQGDATRLDIRLRYNPPAGTLGHLVAAIFGMDPKHAMDEDLVRLKSLLEQGKTRVAGHTVTRDQAGVAQQERQPPAG